VYAVYSSLLDAADEGRPAAVTRDQRRVAAVDADRLVYFLTRLHPSGVQAVADGDGWSLFLPGVPVAADGATIEEAVEEMVDALRDYAEAWTERLGLAANHQDNWGLVQIVTLASGKRGTHHANYAGAASRRGSSFWSDPHADPGAHIPEAALRAMTEAELTHGF
jgi:hypothetical protein